MFDLVVGEGTERPVESLDVAVAGSHGYSCSDKQMIVELFDGVRKRIRTAKLRADTEKPYVLAGVLRVGRN